MSLRNHIHGVREAEHSDEHYDIEHTRNFLREVDKIAKKYGVNYFIVSDGASATRNNGNAAVREARKNHEKWERSHGFDPDEDWGDK